MVSSKNKGKCYLCRKEFTKSGMVKHLLSCNNLGNGKTKYFLLRVEDIYDKNYWLYLQVKATTTLDALDDFLRNIWLECCGHLSSFKIDNTIYDKVLSDEDIYLFDDFDVNEEMSSFKHIDVIEKGSTFTHEYDFGSTTTLKIKVVDKYTGINSLEDISLLARNNKKEFICEKCEKDATYFLTDYEYSDYQLLCDDCIKNLSDDEVEETLFIKITNSPRMGICGYTGENDVYELE